MTKYDRARLNTTIPRNKTLIPSYTLWSINIQWKLNEKETEKECQIDRQNDRKTIAREFYIELSPC